MAYSKSIIVLANSFKHGGTCVAGRELTQERGWIRPVSERPGSAISFLEQRYADNSVPKLLDVVSISLTKHEPRDCHTENHVIAATPWTKVRTATKAELDRCIEDTNGPLWKNGSSTAHGQNDCMKEAEAATFDHSLKLTAVSDLSVTIWIDNFTGQPKRKYRGTFTAAGFRYNLSITDPDFIQRYAQQPAGEYNVGSATLCISLSEPFNGSVYKLIAGVICP